MKFRLEIESLEIEDILFAANEPRFLPEKDYSKIEENNYIYGVQCGDKNCYACATQRYNCNELNKLDKLEDEKNDIRTTS